MSVPSTRPGRLFEGLVAWFAPSVPLKYKTAWLEHGGLMKAEPYDVESPFNQSKMYIHFTMGGDPITEKYALFIPLTAISAVLYVQFLTFWPTPYFVCSSISPMPIFINQHLDYKIIRIDFPPMVSCCNCISQTSLIHV